MHGQAQKEPPGGRGEPEATGHALGWLDHHRDDFAAGVCAPQWDLDHWFG